MSREAQERIHDSYFEVVRKVQKYDPNQPRDDHGRWTDAGDLADPSFDPRTGLPSSELIEHTEGLTPFHEREDLNAHEKRVINGYAMNDSVMVNSLLRGERPQMEKWVDAKIMARAESMIPEMDEAVAKSVIETDAVLYRGVPPSVAIDLKVGDEYTDLGFQSYSVVLNEAFTFAKSKAPGVAGHDPTVLRTRVREGDTGLWLGGEGTPHETEMEFVLPRGTAYRVAAVENRTYPNEWEPDRPFKWRLVTLEMI